MASNHLPDGVSRGAAGGGPRAARATVSACASSSIPAKAGNLTSAGAFGWSGAAGTHFFVDREEDLVGVFMIQKMGGGGPRCRRSSRRSCIRPSWTDGNVGRRKAPRIHPATLRSPSKRSVQALSIDAPGSRYDAPRRSRGGVAA